MRIGYRTLKTAVGASLAIYLAQLLGLQFAASAGVLAILCVQITKKRSLKNAYSRILSCFLGLLFGIVVFRLLGYHAYSFFLIVLLLVPVLVRLKIQDGFISASVIILHLLTLKAFTLSLLWNESALIVIGIGMGLLVNGYMPDVERDLKKYQQRLEENFRVIMQEMVRYLRTNESEWNGKEIIETADLIEQAKSVAIRNVENHLLRNKDYYYRYFQMREHQFELLERMVPLVSRLAHSVVQGEKIADFLDHLSQHIHPGNTASIYLEKLDQMKAEIRKSELPKTREEFETRATLFYFLTELERYLIIKRELTPYRTHDHSPKN